MDITYYLSDVILPDETDEIFANEAGRKGIENLVDGPIKSDDFALEANPGWLGTDGSEIPGLPGRARLADLLARSGLRVATKAAMIAAVANPEVSPLEFLLAVMRDPDVEPAMRVKVAQPAAPFVHPKPTGVPGDAAEVAETIDSVSLEATQRTSPQKRVRRTRWRRPSRRTYGYGKGRVS